MIAIGGSCRTADIAGVQKAKSQLGSPQTILNIRCSKMRSGIGLYADKMHWMELIILNVVGTVYDQGSWNYVI